MLYVATVRTKRYGKEKAVQFRFDAKSDDEATAVALKKAIDRGLVIKDSELNVEVSPVSVPYKLVQ